MEVVAADRGYIRLFRVLIKVALSCALLLTGNRALANPIENDKLLLSQNTKSAQSNEHSPSTFSSQVTGGILDFVPPLPEIPTKLAVGAVKSITYTIINNAGSSIFDIRTNYDESSGGEITRQDQCSSIDSHNTCQIVLKIAPSINGAVPRALPLQLVISANHGSIRLSDVAHSIQIGEVPTITTQPQGQIVRCGSSFTLIVAASGTGPLHYQWYKGATKVGNDSATYTSSNAQLEDSGKYSVMVSNDYGSATSNEVTVKVGEAPTITTQPQDQIIDSDKTLTLTVGAIGAAPISYQWYKNKEAVDRATSDSLIIPNAQPTDNGKYKVAVYNDFGSIVSNEITVIVNPNHLIYAGTNKGLSVSRDGGKSWALYTTANGLGFDAINGVYANGDNIYVATAAGLSVSKDNGKIWNTYTTAHGLGSNYIWAVYASGNTIYAATTGGLSVSSDGGTTWSNYTPQQGLGGKNVLGVYAVENTIYVAAGSLDNQGGGVSISRDNGQSWTTIRDALGSAYVTGIYVSGNNIYAATTGGLSISRDGGNSWSSYKKEQGLGSDKVGGVYAIGSTIYAATSRGLSISRDNGQSWTTYSGADRGAKIDAVNKVHVVGTSIYVATDGGLSISNDNGQTWITCTTDQGLGNNYVRDVYSTPRL